MKKILLMTVVLLGIPFFVVFYFDFDNNTIKRKEIKFDYISNKIIRVMRVSKNRIDRINLEDYVVGAVEGEMPAEFEKEALKAQAVASRSYALKKMNDNKNGSYDVVDTTSNQVYMDEDDLKNKWGDKYDIYINKIRKAVKDTYLEYLEYNGKIANTMFFSTSNGYTEDSKVVFSEDLPYLRSVESKWDKKVNSNFYYETILNLKDFYNILNIKYNDKLNVIILERSSSNRIVKLKINGVDFSGRDLYNKLKIRSTDFEIVQKGKKVLIKTCGYGHGVGMSQYGALGMARSGYKYTDILSHYYVGTKLKKI